ncbi:MAG: AMP-binding protein [Acidobacteriaceae bacterium]|nr:AMP-binding protein [Acidobacteriaceae bacterium]
MQVEDFLEHSADTSPDKVALVCGFRRLTYAEIDAAANQLARALIQRGLQRWDRVAIYTNNCVESVFAIFAVLKARGVFVLINPTTKEDKLAYILNDCDAAALITIGSLIRTAAKSAALAPCVRNLIVANPLTQDIAEIQGKQVTSLSTAVEGQQSERMTEKNIDVDLAALIYTSGSTGQPKGVMLTHLNMVSAATSITTYLENTPDDVILNVLPLSFDYGLYQLLMAFKVGGTLVLEQSFTYRRTILNTLAREHVTGFPIVPTIASILLQMDLSSYSFPDLRYITNTAAALPVTHIRRLREAFPHVKIFSMYGLTECKRVSYLPPDQLDIRPESVGRGMPNEEVYVMDELGNRLGPRMVGELVVRGANVMKGYWNLPAETAKVLRPGPFPDEKVLYTGDLFRTDEEGYLYFVGRKDDMIQTRGEKVSPREVENVLYSHPKIAEAAVIGVPDEVLGNAICAFVSTKPGEVLSEMELRGFCAENLEDFMVPQIVQFRPTLPKSANGKIAKRELRLEAEMPEEVVA